ncbi:hypothetical protein ABIB35_001770 [Arthrobacter sp. UYP6]|uniref:hypothetical protein n=1 Tax=Arthrobacter sp. UYP6 TaxID=1756378 RepID=UPI0033953D86
MGNQQRTPEEEYRHYARPEPGRTGNWVEVLDDGSGRGAQADAEPVAGQSSGSDERPDSTGADNGSVPGQVPAGPPAVQRRNLSLWAAWALVALTLIAGLGWLFGVFEPNWDTYAVDTAGPGASDVTAETTLLSPELESNLYSLGPFAMVFGMLGAVILLTVQALLFRRAYPAA